MKIALSPKGDCNGNHIISSIHCAQNRPKWRPHGYDKCASGIFCRFAYAHK